MDDDPDVCDLIQAMLERKGFNVSVTKDGAEAIRAFTQARESGNPFHVIFMDLTVPGGLGNGNPARAAENRSGGQSDCLQRIFQRSGDGELS